MKIIVFEIESNVAKMTASDLEIEVESSVLNAHQRMIVGSPYQPENYLRS